MSDTPAPNEPKLFMFSKAVWLCKKLIPNHLRNSAGTVLFGITPQIPVSLVSTLSKKAPKRAFMYGALITWFFSFLVIAVWTAVTGMFHGSDPNRVYFGRDGANLINYLILCPIWVGLSVALVVLACQSWVRLTTDPLLSGSHGARSPRLPLGLAFFVVIGCSAGFTCNFISECLNPAVYGKVYWFISSVNETGQRIIGPLGVYYSLLTYSFFLTGFSATVALIPLFAIAAEAGRCFRAPSTTAPASFDALRESLSDFMNAYVVAKALTVVMMLNYFTWRWMEPRHSINVVALGILLTLVGLFFVSVPRYYIELEWYELSVRRAQAAGEPIPIESGDLRSRNVRLFAHLVDSLLIGGFISSFFYSFIKGS